MLGLKKKQPETILTKLACGGTSHRKPDVSVAQMHIKLLSLIQPHSGIEYVPLVICWLIFMLVSVFRVNPKIVYAVIPP